MSSSDKPMTPPDRTPAERIAHLARTICGRIERGEISIGRMSEITGLTHQELMALHLDSDPSPLRGTGEMPPATTTNEEVNAGIDRLAEQASRHVTGTSGHAWGRRAAIQRQAERLKKFVASPEPPPTPTALREWAQQFERSLK